MSVLAREEDLSMSVLTLSHILASADWRRLNVGITRARSGLIIFGDSGTLSADKNWREYLTWLQVHQSLLVSFWVFHLRPCTFLGLLHSLVIITSALAKAVLVNYLVTIW